MFKLEIATENAAFEEGCKNEICRILEVLVLQIHAGKEPSTLNDYNGNKVCKITWDILK